MKKRWWQYWIPGLGQYLALRDAIQEKDIFAGAKHSLGIGLNDEDQQSPEESSVILGEVLNNSRQQFLEDRAHTEMREDTGYQRAVEDMRKAGLNPYTVGSSPSPSSPSTVGENSIMTKLQVLGYILDIKNLDLKNRQVANAEMNTIIRALK